MAGLVIAWLTSGELWKGPHLKERWNSSLMFSPAILCGILGAEQSTALTETIQLIVLMTQHHLKVT